MNRNLCLRAFYLLTILGLFIFALSMHPDQRVDAQSGGKRPAKLTIEAREDAHRANNLGVAQLEQFNYKDAAAEFRKALAIDPEMKIAQINLGLALFNAQEVEESLLAARRALELDPQLLQAQYLLGMIARNQNRADDAVRFFLGVLAADPQDVGANVNLGQIYTQQRKYSEAIEVFRRAYNAEPYNSTAIYNLATLLIRTEQRAEGQKLIERFQALRQSGAATSIGQNYLEQGRYAEGLVSTGAEPELVDRSTPKILFGRADIGLPETGTKAVPSRGRRNIAAATTSTLFDFDNDHDPDLLQTGSAGSPARIFRNDAGKFTEVSRSSGDLSRPLSFGVNGTVAGDFDNDAFEDVLVFGSGKIELFKGDGKGRFTDVTAAAKLAAVRSTSRSGAFVDIDHDGDLDIFLGGWGEGLGSVSENKLLRNNGDGTFSDISAAAAINVLSRAVAVVPTDYDNRRDLDVLVLSYGRRPSLFQNLRNGSFRDTAADVGLDRAAKWTCAAAGDFNKDTFVDFYFGREGASGIFAVSDGKGKFILEDAPAGTEDSVSAQFIDYDSDGLIDLVAAADKGFTVLRNLGGTWAQADARPFRSTAGSGQFSTASPRFVSADIDRDGDVDLLTTSQSGSLQFLRNTGGEVNRSEIIDLKGRVSNRSGVGSKIDMRAGSLSQKLESYSASPMPAPSDIHFGLGERERPDAVRVIWPSGVIQAEVVAKADRQRSAFAPLTIEELDRKPSSCPYLYTWNGERFEFITDFLGGGEMGNWQEKGVYHYPDPDEFVRIPSDKLKPKNGRYEIRVTNELEEVLFVDQLKLVAVEHDADSEIYPNEGLGIPTAGKQMIYTTANERPPLSATDKQGKSVLPEVEQLDRDFYDSFRSLNVRGYAETHSLTMKLDDRKGYNGRTLLLMTGWTDYAFSSDNVAASQSGRSLFFPKLQVKNKQGRWQTVIDSIGISVGRPQTVVVDLTGKFLSPSRDVRIVTNVKTYWDKIAVDSSEEGTVRTTELRPDRADLRERGYSDEARFGGMIVPNYERVVNDGRWKYFSGRFTRTGDVMPLLNETDDVFVISKTGDELVLSFPEMPDAPEGKKYTFLLYADGYSKEMDINSGSPEAVLPLPFMKMTKYPYAADERYPMTDERLRVFDEYTTRTVKGSLPRLESVLIK